MAEMESRASLPLPVPDLDSAPFWQGCREGRLLLQRCTACGRFRYPPRPGCPHCSRVGGASWEPVSGRGHVYSWEIAHHPVHPGAVGRVPYNVVLVELDEGPRIVSNLLDTEPSEIRAGMPVEVVFERVSEAISLPRFRRRRE